MSNASYVAVGQRGSAAEQLLACVASRKVRHGRQGAARGFELGALAIFHTWQVCGPSIRVQIWSRAPPKWVGRVRPQC